MSHLGDLGAALVDDELEPDARLRALTHLSGCASCRHEVDQLERLKRRLRAMSALSAGPLGTEVAAVDRLLGIAQPASTDEPDDDEPLRLANRVPRRAAAEVLRSAAALSFPRPPAGLSVSRPAAALSFSRLTGAAPTLPRSTGPARAGAATGPTASRHAPKLRARYVAAASLAASVVVGIGGGVTSGGAVGQGQVVSPSAPPTATVVPASETGTPGSRPLPFRSVPATGAVTVGYRLP